MIGRPLSPMSVGGMRRRSRRRGLMVGAAVGAAAARNNNQAPAADEPAADATYDQPAAQPAQTDTYAELEKLGQLKTEGILTEEEFQAKKKQILGL